MKVPPLPTVPQAIFLFLLGGVFIHFLQAGIRTFARSADDDHAGWWAPLSFIGTGTVATWFQGLYLPMNLYNAIAGGVILLCSVALYEWARQTIWGRRFHAAWSGAVPESLCDEGPYAYIRHPLYASYLLAFIAVLVTLPNVWSVVVLAFNTVLFAHAIICDERSISRSPLAAAYAEYKSRTGMIVPSRRPS